MKITRHSPLATRHSPLATKSSSSPENDEYWCSVTGKRHEQSSPKHPQQCAVRAVCPLQCTSLPDECPLPDKRPWLALRAMRESRISKDLLHIFIETRGAAHHYPISVRIQC